MPQTLSSDAPSPPERIRLTGPSDVVDPRYHAVRRDLADIRLAHRVLAPAYAAPMARRCVAGPAPVRVDASPDAVVVAHLRTGDLFEALSISATACWGIVVAEGLVGYVEPAAIGVDPAS